MLRVWHKHREGEKSGAEPGIAAEADALQGFALGVDVGGTNFRVCGVTLHGDATYDAQSTKVTIPRELMATQEPQERFGCLAKGIREFLVAHYPDKLNGSHRLNLGFCFSFPVYQPSIDSRILLRWTNGFDIRRAVGADVCELLQVELDRMQLPIRISAHVNDAMGTIMTRVYTLAVGKARTVVGGIFGTGTNGVYLESLSKITKDIGAHDASTGEMFISTEWGSLDHDLAVLSTTKFDTEIDAASVNPGYQKFEKRVAGIYLGELLTYYA
jgi:hexokinase